MGWLKKALGKSLGTTKAIYDPLGWSSGGPGRGGIGTGSDSGPSGSNWWDQIGRDGPDDLTKKRIGEIYNLFQGAQSDSALGFAKAKASAGKQIPLVNETFDRASANAMKLAENTKRSVLEREPGRVAAGNMDLGRRGFGNSNLANLQSRGIRGDTTKALMEIDDFFTSTLNRLETNRASALSDVYGRQGSFDAAGGSEQAQLKTALASMISQFQQAPKRPNDFQQALGFAADAAPLLALL